MFDELKKRARKLLPDKAFLRADRGGCLFVTNSPRFEAAEEVIKRLTDAGFSAEMRPGLIAFGPNDLTDGEIAFIKTGDVRELHKNSALAMRAGDRDLAARLEALDRKRRFTMKITWLKHSCFRIENDEGHVLVTDPFDGHVGYPVPDCYADVVTVSHGHGDHSYTEELKGPAEVVNTIGRHTLCGFDIEGFSSFHDDENGRKRGDNVIYKISCCGTTVVHLGDLGHMPGEDLINALKGADVLLIPIGGFFTIDTDTAIRVIDALQPKLAVGMHFRMKGNGFPISDASEFIARTGAAVTDEVSFTVPGDRRGTLILAGKDA